MSCQIAIRTFWALGCTTLIFLSAYGGQTDPAEIKARPNQPIAVAMLNMAPISACPSGGITIQSGIDVNANQILELTEASSTQYVCDGLDGLSGTSSLNALVLITSEAAGAHCATGGSLVSVGLDSNSNSMLESGEITSFKYICNGARGTTGATGATGATGETGPSGGGLSAYAYIYNLSPQTVEIMKDKLFEKSAVLFDSNGVMVGVRHEPGSDQIIIDNSGVYYLNFSISGTEPNQFAIFVNDKVAAGSVYGSGAGTQQTFGQVIIELSRGDVLRLVNYSSDAAVGLASVIGGTQANVNASMVIQKLN